MSRIRTIIYGGVVGAVLGIVFAPRHGESRRVAVDRLRLAVRSGRGGTAAFAGTPCGVIGRTGGGSPGAAHPESPAKEVDVGG